MIPVTLIVLLVLMALSGSVLSRMPISTAMLYLGAGVVAGPLALGLAAPAWGDHARLLEHMTEVIVLLSLFTSGLKMSVGLNERRWFPPLRLALVSMVATVLLVTAAGVWLLGLPLDEAVRMASTYPADFLGLGASHGRIAAGYQADLVALDSDCRVLHSWIGGAVSHDP